MDNEEERPAPLYGFGAAAVDGRIIVTGGAALPGAVPNARGIALTLVYDPALDEWASLADMPVERQRHASVAVGQAVYVIGGGNKFGILSRADRYDVAANRWSEVGGLSSPLEGLSAAVLDGHVYVFGGHRVHGGLSDKVLVWDTGTLDVTAVAKLATTWGALRQRMPPD